MVAEVYLLSTVKYIPYILHADNNKIIYLSLSSLQKHDLDLFSDANVITPKHGMLS